MLRVSEETKAKVRLDMEAHEKAPDPAACESPRRQPSPFGDDTHVVVTKVEELESTDNTGAGDIT